MVKSSTNPAQMSVQGEGLHVDLDRSSAVPIHVQLEVAIRDAIRNHRLSGGSVLPASRRLAEQLGVSRGVVVEAYQQLTAEGYLVSGSGGYTRVAEDLGRHGAGLVGGSAPPSAGPAIDFRYGRPDISQFPRAAWLKTLRSVLTNAPTERLNYLDGRGAPELRAALAGYLNRVRGTWAEPDNVIAMNGFAQAVTVMFPVLVARGITRLAVEDPSDPDARREARNAGMTLIPIPVTPTGIDTDLLAASDAQAVLLTPAHQFPTGCVLSPERRAALVAWAKETGGLIIEDDYDAEYRYDQTPVGALQGLAPERIIYAGTASKTLAPGLRIGWVVAPEPYATAFAARKREIDRGSPVIDQLAFAEFIEKGEFDRHLRKMRPVYRRRRDVLLEAMAARLPFLAPIGAAAGLHVFCWLPDDVRQGDLVAAAAERGLTIEGWTVGASDAIVLGYSNLDDDAIRDGVAELAEAVDAVRSGFTLERT